jgi:hypothetical protein
MPSDIAQEIRNLIVRAQALTSEVGNAVGEMLREGLEHPLSPEEAVALLGRAIEMMRNSAELRNDSATVAMLSRDEEALLEQARNLRENLSTPPAEASPPRVELQPFDGIDPYAVLPTPIFHERPVAVFAGFIRTRDIKLWEENVRLDIHLNQFQQKYGRKPDSDELLAIMLGNLALPGIEENDQFAIKSLAKSIAVNGVRKAPIIDLDGTLLDGNRRVTACYFILNSPDFSAEEKQRAEWLKVWQLTEHATDADRESVIVSLNFEPDFKKDWPEYVKAQKVYEHWETLLALEPRANPAASRLKEIRRDIARRFALATDEVTRYISMVEMAHEFEDYHVSERNKDQYETKHRASDKFQYFDELTKGKQPGGVNWCLNQDDAFKHLVYDLLFDHKFQAWKQIRDLKYIYQNEDALTVLRKARDETDLEEAQEQVDNAIGIARMGRAEQRQAGANTRIKVFADWFSGLPVKAFDTNEPGSVTADNLHRLHVILKLVEGYLPSDSQGSVRDGTA